MKKTIKQLEEIGQKAKTMLSDLWSEKIARNPDQPLTREYREFCTKIGMSVVDGIYHYPGDPFPLKEPMKCDECGAVFRFADIGVIIHDGRRRNNEDSVEPHETWICPSCCREMSADKINPATPCITCDCVPCCCIDDYESDREESFQSTENEEPIL